MMQQLLRRGPTMMMLATLRLGLNTRANTVLPLLPGMQTTNMPRPHLLRSVIPVHRLIPAK